MLLQHSEQRRDRLHISIPSRPNFLVDVRYGFVRTFIDFTVTSAGFVIQRPLGFPNMSQPMLITLLFPAVSVSNYVGLGDGLQGPRAGGPSFQTHLFGVKPTTKVSGQTLHLEVRSRGG